MKRFYINEVFTAGEIINVPHEIVRHIHVLRLTLGEAVELFDGNNQSYLAEIINLEKHNATLKIVQKNHPTPAFPIKTSLAIALVANDKMDLIIQKAVELGVHNIIPVYSERSARLVANRKVNRLAHWQNIILSSCSQCGQNQLPTIDLPITLDLLYEKLGYDIKIILNPHTDQTNNHLSLATKDINHAIMLVGPEGGFTETEVKIATQNHYQSVQLGNLIMRAETAVIAGLSVLNIHLRKWSL